MRPLHRSEGGARLRTCGWVALGALILAVPVRAGQREESEAAPAGARAAAAVEESPSPGAAAGRRPAHPALPGLVTPDRIWRSPPPAASYFDPGSGAVYYPGMGLAQFTIIDGATGKPIVVYYAVPHPSGTRDPSYYLILLARAVADAARRAQAQKAVAPAPAQPSLPLAGQEPSTRAGEPPGPPRAAFISKLAPMLGGPDRAPLRFVVGEARLRQGKSTGAALAFEQSAADFRGDPTPALAHGVALMVQGDYAGAATSIRRGLEGLADWHSLHVDWPVALGGEDMAQSAEDDLRRRVAREPTDEDAVLVLAFYLFAARRDAMAVDVLGGAAGAQDPLLGRLQAEAARRVRVKAEARQVRTAP